MKNLLTGIVVLIALAIIYFFFFGSNDRGEVSDDVSDVVTESQMGTDGDMMEDAKTNEEADADTPSENMEVDTTQEVIVIEYTSEGFAPSDIEVLSGQKVRFVNKSGRGMWVASALHPTHQVFPEFDQLESGAPDSIYEFTFTEIGSWKYHNHVRANHTGSITVVAN